MLPKNYPTYEDGTPVEIGDRIMLGGEECKVWTIEVLPNYARIWGENPRGYSNLERISPDKHIQCAPEPDTLEKIKADAKKMTSEYWKCGDAICRCCPATQDGKKPSERYDVGSCVIAQYLDLIERTIAVMERGVE